MTEQVLTQAADLRFTITAIVTCTPLFLGAVYCFYLSLKGE